MRKIAFFIFIISCATSSNSFSQNITDVDLTFPNEGFNNTIKTSVIQSDGKILLGGNFTTLNGTTANRIIRLNIDGTADNSFNSGIGINDYVSAIAIQADGKILLGGNFISPSKRIIRLNSDGSIDTSFISGTGFNNYVSSIVIQNDGKIIVGGNFTTYNGILANRIIRLNADGSIDNSFVTGTGFDNYVKTIALQSNGKLIVGGDFITYKGVSENRIIRLNTNGSKDTTFITGSGFDFFVSTIRIQSSGKILIGGNFSNYNQNYFGGYFLRLNSNGTIDTSFSTTDFSTIGGCVNAIITQSDGKILLGGDFTFASNHIIRLNTDGTTDTNFITSSIYGNGFNNNINSFSIQQDGNIIVVGDFTTYKNAPLNYIIRLKPNGITDTSFFTGKSFNDVISPIAVQLDGKIIVGGNFTSYNGNIVNRLIRLNTDKTQDTTFEIGNGFGDLVNAIAIQPNGKIIVGGNFTNIASHIIRLNSDGSIDTSFNCVINGNVTCLAIQSDGKILVGGGFTYCGGSVISNFARLNLDGSRDTSFWSGIGSLSSSSIAIQQDGKILIGVSNIVRLNVNGSNDFSLITTLPVTALSLQPDGKIVIAQGFNQSNRVFRLKIDGTIDSSFTSFNITNKIECIAILSNGKILIGGNLFACLNSDGNQDNSFNSGTGFNNIVNKIMIQPGGKILVSGNFSSYNGIFSRSLIRLKGESILSNETITSYNNMVIYPNPSIDKFTIDFGNELNSNYNIKINNMLGQEVYSNVIDKPQFEVINTWGGKGLYFVKIFDDKNNLLTTKKIILE